MRLDFNENTVGCPPQVIRALRRELDPEMMTRYPEYGEDAASWPHIFASSQKKCFSPMAPTTR